MIGKSPESMSESQKGFGVESMTLEQRLNRVQAEYDRYPGETMPFNVLENIATRYGVTNEELFAHLSFSSKKIDESEKNNQSGLGRIVKKLFGGK